MPKKELTKEELEMGLRERISQFLGRTIDESTKTVMASSISEAIQNLSGGGLAIVEPYCGAVVDEDDPALFHITYNSPHSKQIELTSELLPVVHVQDDIVNAGNGRIPQIAEISEDYRFDFD